MVDNNDLFKEFVMNIIEKSERICDLKIIVLFVLLIPNFHLAKTGGIFRQMAQFNGI
jgi:hypothetical protein